VGRRFGYLVKKKSPNGHHVYEHDDLATLGQEHLRYFKRLIKDVRI
jgi:hypothetical protein